MHIERSFAHLLDCGGMRRATLRGQRNLDKRYKIAAATYNLSQLMRHRFGVGTPKQAAAGVGRVLFALFLAARRRLADLFPGVHSIPRFGITIFGTDCFYGFPPSIAKTSFLQQADRRYHDPITPATYPV